MSPNHPNHYPSLYARLRPAEEDGRRLFDVVCTASLRVIGQVWPLVGNRPAGSWYWRAPGGHGERSTQRAAVAAVRDVANQTGWQVPPGPADDAEQPAFDFVEVPRAKPKPKPKPAPAPIAGDGFVMVSRTAAPTKTKAAPAPAPAWSDPPPPEIRTPTTPITWDDNTSARPDLLRRIADKFGKESK